MINPFYPFTRALLEALVKKGHRYFVRQTYRREKNTSPGFKGAFLLTHYDSVTTAMDHYGAISYDAARFFYDWENAEHRRRLCMAADGPEGYKLYAALFRKDWERPVQS